MTQKITDTKMKFLKRENAPDLAYIKYEGRSDYPTIMFLGGFYSNMMGSKAHFLEEDCKRRTQSYIRFDYSGHGQSEGKFEEGCITDWTKDAYDILTQCTSGNVILVGSSMGGWISLLLAQKGLSNVQALVGIAAAPDFTRWIENKMDNAQRSNLEKKGFFSLSNDYEDPYVITQKLLEDGQKNVLLEGKIKIDVPVRLLQGKKDADVPWETAARIQKALTSDNIKIFYQKDGNHSLSAPEDLSLLGSVVQELSNNA